MQEYQTNLFARQVMIHLSLVLTQKMNHSLVITKLSSYKIICYRRKQDLLVSPKEILFIFRSLYDDYHRRKYEHKTTGALYKTKFNWSPV